MDCLSVETFITKLQIILLTENNLSIGRTVTDQLIKWMAAVTTRVLPPS
jgi:hypothetical protein